MSVRPLSATILAAAAVFSQTVTFTSGSPLRKALHWPMACSWEQISRMSWSLVPGRAIRLWLMWSLTPRTMWKSKERIRSYTPLTLPWELFSMGRTPYWHSPFCTAENTPSQVRKYMMSAKAKVLSQACWA